MTGRALSNTFLKMPDISLFTRHFIEAKEIGVECGVDVGCSASAVFRKFSFCGATYNNFVITPDGLISSCVEVSSLQDSLADFFILGEISDGRVNINAEKLSAIRQYDEEVRLECLNCISNKSCRGNCPVRTKRFQKAGYAYLNELCIMQTKLFVYQVALFHEMKELDCEP